jgi:ATP-dependent Zn protease
MPIAEDVDFSHVAEETFGWTPAELEKLCLTAGRIAMKSKAEKVDASHFETALGTIEINMAERGKRVQEMYDAMKKLDIVSKQFLDQSLSAWQSKETDKSRVQSFINKLD